MQISIFKDTYSTIPEGSIEVKDFINSVKSGKWQDQILRLRTLNEDERKEEKKKLPLVTISGVFSSRADKNIITHSGLIAIDFDNVENLESLKELLANDKYCYSVFTSCSGRGLCMLIKINPEKHRESFDAIQDYIYSTYNEVVSFDTKVKNESRSRFVSFDPHAQVNEHSAKFTKLLKKKEIKYEKVIFVNKDFDEIVKNICRRCISLGDSYGEWLNIGFGLADTLGENGRPYFHLLSQYSHKYSAGKCDKQYDNCLKAGGSGITIATLYYYAKRAGIELYSEETKKIASISYSAKKSGKSKEDTIKNIVKYEGVEEEYAKSVVSQVFDNDIELKGLDSIINDIKLYLKYNYNLRLNTVTNFIENNGVELDDVELNSLLIEIKTIFGENLKTSLIKEIIHSKFVESFNPFLEYLKEHEHLCPVIQKENGVIKIPTIVLKLWESIETGANDKNYMIEFGTKWLVSIIGSMHGIASPLMLILVGEMNTGKSKFFELLLPDKLKKYFGNPDLTSGKDLQISMCQKILILDDEVTGKSRGEDAKMKSLLSAPSFTLRKPYGSANVDMKRIAVLCGTSNPVNILTDPEGNRRFLPIKVFRRDFAMYDSIDRDSLFMALYALYKEGFKFQLTNLDIVNLKVRTGQFESHSMEYELIVKYYENSAMDGDFAESYTATEIKIFIENTTNQKLSMVRLSAELNALRIPLDGRKDARGLKKYMVKKIQYQTYAQ